MAGNRYCSECGNRQPDNAPQEICATCLLKTGQSGASPVNQNDIPTQALSPFRFIAPDPAVLTGQFPQLEILELLGQGGMGAVYKARQRHLDRLVALKILPPHIGQTQAFSERFLREARSLARLNHARIVSIYDFGCTENNLYYFIMEFVDGMDLRRMIQTRKLSVPDILTIIPQICEALQYAHEEGVVHRDIKPENILLNKKGQIRIADFGLAKLLDQPAIGTTLTQVGQTMGTPHYMAPEQIEHPNEVDHRADIYSLGVVFYEMLTGELPLGRFATPSEITHADVRLDRVVLRALDKEPKRRYQHASDMKTDVETISSSECAVTSYDSFVENEFKAVQQRLRRPAIGLKVAGSINCLVSLPMLLAWMGISVAGDVGAPASIITGGTGLAFALIGLLTCVGAQRMTRLRSYGLAVTTGIIQLIPSPGFAIGIWFGIWILVLMTRNDIHRVFVQAIEPGRVQVGGKVERITLWTLAGTATFVFFLAILQSLGHGRFPWFVFLFGLPLVVLDLFTFGQWTGRAVPGPGQMWEQVKTEIKRMGKKHTDSRQQDTVPDTTRQMTLGSSILGVLGVFLSSLHMAFAVRFTLVFISAVFALFLGIPVIKKIRPYQEHLLDTGLAAAGIIAALISIFALFASMM